MKINAIISGRLLLMGLLIVIRWICQLPYFIFLVLFSLFETIVNGITLFIAHLQKLNNELFAAAKQRS